MGVLDLMEDIDNEENPQKVEEILIKFENHPIQDLSLEIKILYLYGVSLMMDVDGEIHEKEKEYLLILINSLRLSQDLLDDIIEFSKNPDKEEIEDIFKVIKRNNIIKIFLVDLLMISLVDGKQVKNEKKFFRTTLNIFKVDEKIIKDLELFIKYVYIKTKKAYQILKQKGFSLKLKDVRYLLKFYNIKENGFNEGDYRIYFDEYFAELKDEISFFDEFDYENSLIKYFAELKDEISFFDEFD